jgi:histidinol dehydrogenase
VDRGAEGYLAQRYVPLRRVGICVPGGAAAYPSTVLMTAVPAQVAGVEQLAIVAPPTPYGADNPVLRAVCWELGIDELYRLGGAQAVVALALGVEGVPRVDKIVGPGNLFVALAKKLVYGEVAIDSLAGPSEVVVIADDSTPPPLVAADMLAQAEHAPGASILVTWSPALAEAVVEQLEEQLTGLPRGAQARDSLESFGAVVLVRDAAQAAEVADLIAPEHLHLALDDARELLPRVRNAGAVFVGPYSTVALGDYAAGPSHVLPTGGTARFASGLSANDFLRGHSVLHFTRQGLEALAEDVCRLAEVEGLTAHRASVELRRGGRSSASGR